MASCSLSASMYRLDYLITKSCTPPRRRRRFDIVLHGRCWHPTIHFERSDNEATLMCDTRAAGAICYAGECVSGLGL